MRSRVATCESNENGRFSAQLGLAKLCLKAKSKMLFFSERQNYFKKKNLQSVCIQYMQKTSEFEFSSLAEET